MSKKDEARKSEMKATFETEVGGKRIQAELSGMPEMDNVGNEATRYVAMLEDVEGLKMKANHQAAVLLQAMNKANRRFIRIKNRIITVAHIEEQIKLKVSKG